MRYKWLLFDVDDTLIDYKASEEFALTSALKEWDIQADTPLIRRYREINLSFWKKMEKGEISIEELRTARFQSFFENLNYKPDPKEFSRRYLWYFGQTGFLIEGVMELLNSLRPHISLAVITNGITDTQYSRLSISGLTPYFKEIVIADEIGLQKPDPEFFHFTMNKIGRPSKEEVLIIGDSLTSDIQGGNNTGIPCCWFNPEKKNNTTDARPDFEIHSLRELKAIL